MGPETLNDRKLLIFHAFGVTKNHEKSRTAKTSYFEGSMKRNACFHPSSPLIFTSIFHQNIMFFQERFLDLIFLCFFQNFTGKVRFWHPCWTQPGPQWRPKSAKIRKNGLPKTLRRFTFRAQMIRPFFQRAQSAPDHIFHRFLINFP